MAHEAQREFIQACIGRFSPAVNDSSSILEVGSQNINGSIRDYFPDASSRTWLGLDVGNGKGVDFVIPGELIQLPDGWADISFSTECFEHAKNWKQIFLNMIRCTRPNGLIVLTIAGLGRSAHGTVDTESELSPYTTDYYKNLGSQDILLGIDVNKYFLRYAIEVNSIDCDTYFWGIRSPLLDGTEVLTTEESLSRARGQLGVIMIANRELKRQLFVAKSPSVAVYKALLKLWRIFIR